MIARTVCDTCFKPLNTCYCSQLKQIDNDYPVLIIQHSSEDKHPLGTARIVQLSLQNCRTIQVNDMDRFTPDSELQSRSPVLVYPEDKNHRSQSSSQWTPKSTGNSYADPFIFLDGTWRKSQRILMNSPYLQSLPRWSVNSLQPSLYRIRKSPQSHYLSTLESVVYTLGEFEHKIQKYQSLLETMEWMINRQIELMGESVYSSNYC